METTTDSTDLVCGAPIRMGDVYGRVEKMCGWVVYMRTPNGELLFADAFFVRVLRSQNDLDTLREYEWLALIGE